MPRKKKMASKSAPKKMQKQTQTVAQLEKNFKSMPTQIVAHCRKELATLKQHNKELSAAAKSAETLATAIKKKCDQLAQAKPSVRTKKQLSSAKQGYAKAVQAVKAITKELQAIATETEALSSLSAKYATFSKEWTSIEKQLSKKTTAPKATTVKTVTKTKATKLKTKKTDKSMDTTTVEGENVKEEIAILNPSQETTEDTENVETV